VQVAVRDRARPIAVEEIFNQLNCKIGAQLCNWECYARTIPPLQERFGRDAVSAALRQHHAQMRRSVSDQIQQQRRNAARLKRESQR
jgi:hypothetical protein